MTYCFLLCSDVGTTYLACLLDLSSCSVEYRHEAFTDVFDLYCLKTRLQEWNKPYPTKPYDAKLLCSLHRKRWTAGTQILTKLFWGNLPLFHWTFTLSDRSIKPQTIKKERDMSIFIDRNHATRLWALYISNQTWEIQQQSFQLFAATTTSANIEAHTGSSQNPHYLASKINHAACSPKTLSILDRSRVWNPTWYQHLRWVGWMFFYLLFSKSNLKHETHFNLVVEIYRTVSSAILVLSVSAQLICKH